MYEARIDPQAWLNDHALSVDAPGPTAWDCTAFVKAEGLTDRIDAACVSPLSSVWFDRDDVLMGDPNAPQWVKDWTGPFTITVRKLEVVMVDIITDPPKPWEVAYRKWQELADRGYGERCNTPAAMKKVDDRIRRAKAKYEKLLAASK